MPPQGKLSIVHGHNSMVGSETVLSASVSDKS